MKVFYFSADWCVACKTNKPMIKAVCLENNVGFEEVDADKMVEKANMCGVASLPTILIYDDKGEELVRHVGAMTKQQLIKHLYR
jgi:thiol:disulfide interchange protein